MHKSLGARLRAATGVSLTQADLGLSVARSLLGVGVFAAMAFSAAGVPRYGLVLLSWIGLPYLAYTLLLLAAATWRPSWVAHPTVVHVVDVLAAGLLAPLAPLPGRPLLLVTLFAVLAAAWRWGAGAAVASGAAILGLMVFGVETEGWPFSYELEALGLTVSFPSADTLVSGLFVAVLVGYLAGRERLARTEATWLAHLTRKPWSEASLLRAFRDVAADLLAVFDAREVILALRENGHPQTFLWVGQRDGQGTTTIWYRTLPEDAGTVYWALPESDWHLSRAGGRNGYAYRFLAQDTGNGDAPRDDCPGAARLAAAHRFDVVMSVSVPLVDEWSGRVLLFDPAARAGRRDALGLLRAAVAHVAPALFTVYLQRRLRSRVRVAERARVARALHDGVIQTLVGIEMRLDALRRRRMPAPAELAEELAAVQVLLREEVANVRDLTEQLRTDDPDPSQLLEVLADLVERFRKDSGIEAVFLSQVRAPAWSARLSREIAGLVREALSNIRKHSAARHVRVSLNEGSGAWELMIDDDGRGFAFDGTFTLDELDAARRGPLVIKERVRAVGGDLTLASNPGQGARLDIRIPKWSHA